VPSGDLHEELNFLMGARDPGRKVQRLVDSTAHGHGPAHRKDPIHSLEGVVLELAKRGELTGDNVLAAVAHFNQDRAFDAVWRNFPVKGPFRQAVKNEAMKAIARALRENRRRR